MKEVSTIEALNKFTIADKTEELVMLRRKGKFNEILVALKNLANDKTIKLSLRDVQEMYGTKNIKAMSMGMRQAGKKHNLEVSVVEKDGYVYIFNRG